MVRKIIIITVRKITIRRRGDRVQEYCENLIYRFTGKLGSFWGTIVRKRLIERENEGTSWKNVENVC